MSQTAAIIVLAIICLSFVVMIVRKPSKLTRFIGSSAIRAVIGVLLLFFVNVFGANFGLHIPINIFTVLVSSVLGVFGIGALIAAHIFLL